MAMLDASSEVPDKIASYMLYDRATCMRFTRYGNLLAAGTQRSEVTLWDVDTQSIAITLGAPTTKSQAVTSVSLPFPRTGVTVLATHDDGIVRLWDTLAKTMVTEIKFGASITAAEPHPKHPHLIVVVPSDDVPILVQLRKGFYEFNKDAMAFTLGTRSANVPKGTPEVAAEQRKAMPHTPMPTLPPDASNTLRFSQLLPGVTKKKASDKDISYFVKWSRDGTKLIRASSAGYIDTFFLDMDNWRMKHISRCVFAAHLIQILSMGITKCGRHLLVNCQDRTLRFMSAEDVMGAWIDDSSKPKVVEPIHSFKDLVSPNPWNCATISGDGETVAASIDSSEQKISLWNVNTGMIKCTLEGSLDVVLGMEWHPRRCAMATISPSGGIYLWVRNVSENWSAFASDFVELEANEEYSEIEYEFDTQCASSDEEEKVARELEESRIVVDVTGNKDLYGKRIKLAVPGEESDDDQAPVFFVRADPEDPYYVGLEKLKRAGSAAAANGNGRRKRSRTNGVGSASGTGTANGNINGNSRDATSPMQTTETYNNTNGTAANGVGAHHHNHGELRGTFGISARHQ